MREQPAYIVDIMGEIALATKNAVLAEVQAKDTAIETINYQYGHPVEIAETLETWTKGSYEFKKYPLIALFLDVPIKRGATVGVYGEATLHMIVARQTRPELKASERMDYNFKPFLYPVYLELLNQIKSSKKLMVVNSLLDHTQIDRMFWGKESIWGNKGNIFGDWIDCIEIQNLKVKIKPTINC